MTQFAVLIPVGPGEQEIQRFRDVLGSLFYYESSCTNVVIIDDTPDSRHLENLVKAIADSHGRAPEIKVFVNPRKSRGEGWSGGMCASVAQGTQWVSEACNVDFMLRLDTDSLVIAPFSEMVKSKFDSDKSLGQIGTFRRHINGTQRIKRDSEGLITPFLKTFTVKRYGRQKWHVIFTLAGRDRFRKATILRALNNNYALGEFCQGGGYAVSKMMLLALRENGFLDDINLFLDFYIGEDVVMTIFCYACGLKAADFNQDGQAFGVEMGILNQPKDLLKRGYGVIHSIKSSDPAVESSIRSFYRSMRHT